MPEACCQIRNTVQEIPSHAAFSGLHPACGKLKEPLMALYIFFQG
ncbi:hypothetical protein APS_1364 [Acetobacter pasteurianus subsp. pasteurianus LMG 1262 = NBRC 106471]|nr:hypothetical protein APS_1364 [Acetobacter pasteurianus subsp. pasteurianus LMG 1262 = NBRC 106471]